MKDKCRMSFEPQNDGSNTPEVSHSASGCLNGETARAVTRSSCCEERMEAKHIINLAMLSEELERRTKETQKLQEEVEQATRLTLERMGLSNTEVSGNHISTDHESEGSPEFGVNSQQSYIHSINYDVDVNGASCLNFQGRNVLQSALEDYSQQVSDLQKHLRETYELHELQKFNFRQSIIKLENKLQESQTERDVLVNLRLKESQKHAKLMEQLQAAQLELHLLKQTEGQKLMEAEDRVKTLSRREEMMAQMLQDIFTRLSDYETRSGKSCRLCYDRAFSPSQLLLGDAVEKTLQDLENDNRGLQEKLQMVERQLKDLKEQGQGKTESLLQEYKERMEQLITSHEQKVAMLTEKLNSSQTNADGLQHQLEVLQQQLQSQTSLHQSEKSDMERALSTLRSDLLEKQKSYTAKVSVLEEALAQAKSQAEQVQRERDLSLQQAEELDTQLCRLTTELRQTAEELCLERQQRHKLEQRSLEVEQLENLVRSLREQYQRHLDMPLSDTEQQEAQEELEQLRSEIQQLEQANKITMCLHEKSSGEVRRLQSLLDKQDAELPLKQQEVQQGRAQLEEAHTQVQALQTEVELLRLRLEDGKKSGELLMRPLVALQQERKSLTEQLEQLRLDNQQLRAALLEAELRLSAVEQEKTLQRAALSERTSSLHQLTLEKQQMTAELESQRKKLDQLKQEQEALREEHSKKTEELQWQNSKLKAQRNNIRNDLEQVKSTLKALEGADEHGLKVALGIQKQITAKREQVDLLQSRVQMLEETTEKLTQEKNYQVMKSKHQAQELLFERDRRNRLETELEAYHTKENLLKSEIERLDTALHKMSDSFAECQEYIQKQQQEIMRLKLQHTLELKEGQNLRSTSARTCEQGQDLQATNNIHRSPITSPTLPAQVPFQAHSPSQLNIGQRCSPVLELRSLVKELRSVIDMEQSVDTMYTSSRRFEETPRSRKGEVTMNTEGESRKTRPSTSYNEQDPLRAPNLNKQDVNSAFSANNEAGLRADRPCYTSFCVAALGRRSPVHSLLTSDLPTNIPSSLRTQSPALAVQTSVIKQAEITEQTCMKQQNKLKSLQNKAEDCQIKNKEMSSRIKSQEKMSRRIKERKTFKKDKLLDQAEDRRINIQSK
ncbi:coiled-coil domain-containing protein 158 isoform X2 [Pangasianodon hypophthalmus]|uniref:coiled-coil domain-containing protein 158 isoform X2 n=1 Tax=Pangasianodon hypophthalmus TaxID=310915 RepID=UPI002307A195|nr:coiled-coil domain-containing protein 158 isoform X2 [Pangasianodon hypophthalmus]